MGDLRMRVTVLLIVVLALLGMGALGESSPDGKEEFRVNSRSWESHAGDTFSVKARLPSRADTTKKEDGTKENGDPNKDGTKEKEDPNKDGTKENGDPNKDGT